MGLKFKAFLMLAVVLLQVTVLSHFTLFGVIPNCVFVFVLALCIINDNAESVVFATVTGLMVDMLTGAQFGLNTLLYMYIAIGVIVVISFAYQKSIKIVVPMCLCASFMYELIFGILSFLFRGAAISFGVIFSVVIPACAVNTLVFIPVYVILSRLRFEKKRKGIKYERQI
ncbi:MAG: rod shape-determining protein MreD [Clostridia bacterium]|nr:rod shape-determining protein MreD [Clostridia bacterium]